MLEVVDHDPWWASAAADLAERCREALRDVPVVAIEHVGSTAVPGLAAKPVLDLDVVVAREHVGAAIAALEDLGYESLGEQGIEDRWAFRAPPGYPRTNTYVVVEGSIAHRNHLAVRDVLRSDAGLRAEYAALKRHLVATVDDSDAYVEGKSALLDRVLAQGGLDAAERAAIARANRGPA